MTTALKNQISLILSKSNVRKSRKSNWIYTKEVL